MAKESLFRGKTSDELKDLSLDEFAALLTARERRTLKRGLSPSQKKVLEHIQKGKNEVKTHCRDMIVVPAMLGKTIKVYSGKEWITLRVEQDMLGHRLGEFSQTRKSVKHSSPGIGATRSSAFLSVR